MNTKIITSGERLKAIRKKYNIKQYELSGNDFTRNLISMIETDKSNLMQSTAEILLKNIQEICKKKGIECNVTLEYLLESPQNQTKKIFNEFMNILSSFPKNILKAEIQNDLQEIEKLLDKYKLKNEKIKLYSKLCELFNSLYDHYQSYIYGLKTIENYDNPFNNINFVDMVIDISYSCNHLGKYKESLNYINMAYNYMNNMPYYQGYLLNFNAAIAYKNLGDYESVLKQISKIENEFTYYINTHLKKKINVLILKANSLEKISHYNEALEIHKKVLTLTNDNIEMYFVTLCNIIEIYIKMNDSKNIKKYIDICISNLKQYEILDNKKFSAEIFYDIGFGFYTIGKYEISKVYFYRALDESKKHKNKEILLSVLEKLLTILINTNSAKEIENFKKQLIEIISLNLLPSNNTIIFKLIKYYSTLGNIEAISSIVDSTEKNQNS